MRISDWSSDVCSSDLRCALWPGSYQAGLRQLLGQRYGQPDNCLPWASIADLTAMLRTAQTVQIRRPIPRVRTLHHPISRGQSCDQRSEEHTSELQSLMRISYAVFCLKKKKNNKENKKQKYKTQKKRT